MNILFAYDYPESGTESVLRALGRALRELGHTVDEAITDGGRLEATDPQVSKAYQGAYDIAHFWNARSYIPFKDRLDCPFGMSVHGFVRGAEEPYFKALHEYEPDYVHCMDSFVQHRLGQQRIFAFVTPQCVDLEGFLALPPPPTFTIGYTGDIPDFDGFDIIEQIAQRSGFPYLGHNASQRWIPRDRMMTEFFSKISVFVSWAFGACGPVTAQEAMRCGRPVLTTPTDTMRQVVRSGLEGMFFDGSVEDGCKQLKYIHDNYDYMSSFARDFIPNPPQQVAQMFLKKWETLL